MAGRRYYIHELPAKLAFLARRTTNGTMAELQERTHIGKSVFEQCTNVNDTAYSRLGRGHQQKLADTFGFKITWRQWRDPSRLEGDGGDGPDTAQAFADELVRLSGDPASLIGEQGADSQKTQGSKARRTDEEINAGPPRAAVAPMGTMAQVALEPGQPAGPGAHQVRVEVSCHATNIVGSVKRFSVRRALLSIDCRDARGRRESIAGINGVPVLLSNAHGDSLFAWCGSMKRLRWEVTAGGSRIGYLEFDAGVIEEMAHGDVLRVSLSAWLKHIDVVDDEGEPTFGILDANDQLIDQPEESSTIEQQRLIEHLNKLRLPVDANGYAEIAAHEFEVVRKP